MPSGLSRLQDVLLVEDHPVALTLKQDLERRLGLAVIVASDVDQAVRFLSEHPPFAVVVIDIMMTPGSFPGEPPVEPMEAGYRLAEKIREGTLHGCVTPADVHIIFCTGLASESLIREARTRFGAKNVLRKPFQTKVLVKRIKEAIGAVGLIVGAQEPCSLSSQLGERTAVQRWDIARTVEEALELVRNTEYAVVLVADAISEEQLASLGRFVHKERFVTNLFRPDLQKEIAALCCQQRCEGPTGKA